MYINHSDKNPLDWPMTGRKKYQATAKRARKNARQEDCTKRIHLAWLRTGFDDAG